MSPKSKEQYEIIRSQSRLLIMETALELFAQKGFHNTTIKQIAEAAGISKGLMYNYFKSKKALLEAIIFGAADESQHIVDETLAEEVPPKIQLQHLLEGIFQMVERNLQHWKLLTALSFQTEILDQFKEQMDTRRKESMGKFISLFEAIGVENPTYEAFLVGAVLDGAILQYMHLENEYPLQEMKEYIINRFCT